jgi:tetratricopeptide (TPR) repeat protein
LPANSHIISDPFAPESKWLPVALQLHKDGIKLPPSYPLFGEPPFLRRLKRPYKIAVVAFFLVPVILFSACFQNIGFAIFFPIGEFLESKHSYRNAIEAYKAASWFNTSDPAPYYRIGSCNTDLGRFNKAIQAYSLSLRYDPTFACTYCRRAWAYLAIDDKQHALSDFTASIPLLPAHASHIIGRAEVLLELGRNEEATKDLIAAYSAANAAINGAVVTNKLVPPAKDTDYQERARASLDLGHLEEALEDVQQSIKLNPEYYYTYLLRARIKLSTKDYDSALSDLNFYISKYEFNPDAFQKRAIAYEGLGQRNLAAADRQHAADLHKG